MKALSIRNRSLILFGVLASLLAAFVWVVLRSGPLAPVPVTVTTVRNAALSPSLFGLGTVEARYVHRIGPTAAGRVDWIGVDVGDRVRAGQIIGGMEPVDLDDRLKAQTATSRRAEATVRAMEAQVRDAEAKYLHAASQAQRYHALLGTGAVSREEGDLKQRERTVAEAGLESARASLRAALEDQSRLESERDGVQRQRSHLQLISPVDGLVTAREVEPGTTVVAGQSVLQVIDPSALWVDVRFDQISATGLRSALPAQIVLRSRVGEIFTGRVLRIEPLADAITEELRAKVVFDSHPDPLPPLGELAEVTVSLPPGPEGPVVPNASVQRVDGHLGVWLVTEKRLRFVPVEVGGTDLEGRVRILKGLEGGQVVVQYAHRALTAHSRVTIVERIGMER